MKITIGKPGVSLFADEHRRNEVVEQLAEERGYRWIENTDILNSADRSIAFRHLQRLEREAMRQGKPKPTFPRPQPKLRATEKPTGNAKPTKQTQSTPENAKSLEAKCEPKKQSLGCGTQVTHLHADGTKTMKALKFTSLEHQAATRC